MKVALLLVAAVLLAAADAGASQHASERLRRADHPFFNPPESAPLRTGLGRMGLSGGAAPDSAALANLERELGARPLAIVDLRGIPEGDGEGDRLLMERRGHRYARIPSADGCRPEAADVDRFVAFVQGLPDDAWLHIYGAGGEGCTTAFMAMADMMKNAREVPYRDILQRQYANGGTDLRDAKPMRRFSSRDARQRRAFLRRFHEYARKNDDDFATPWSAWVGIKASNKGRR